MSLWTIQEADILRQGVAEGKTFDVIAQQLPGRTVNAIQKQYEDHLHPNIISRPFTQSDLELILYYRFKGVTYKNMAGLVYSDERKGFSPNRLKETSDKLVRDIGGAQTFEEARARLRQAKGLPVDTDPTEVIERAKITSTFHNRRVSDPIQPTPKYPPGPIAERSIPLPPSYATEQPIAKRSIPPQLALATLATVASTQQPVSSSSSEAFTASDQPHPQQSEDQIILDAIAMHGTDNWPFIASFVPGRTAEAVRERYEKYLRGKVVNRPFTPEDDELLLYYYYKGIGYTHMYGLVATDNTPGWPAARLRGRWRSHLEPIAKGNATFEEARTRLRHLPVVSTAAERARAAYAAEPVVKQAAMKRMADETAGPATKRRLRSEEIQMVKLIMTGHTPIQIAEVMKLALPKVVELRTELEPYVYGSVEESLERLRHI